MPLISRVNESNIYSNSGSSGNNFANPNSMLRNSVRPREGERIVMSFLGDIEDGDVSLFHAVPSQSASGKSFSEYVWCTRDNVDEDGKPIVDMPCIHCNSDVKQVRQCRFRYNYWVFVYYHYHMEQNAYLDRDGEVAWELINVGKKQFYRQVVMKPQLFTLSRTAWNVLEDKADTYGTLLGYVFDYSRVGRERNITYLLEKSDVDVPNVLSDVDGLVSSLPSIEEVAMGTVVEHEFPVLGVGGNQSMDDAFNRIAGGM